MARAGQTQRVRIIGGCWRRRMLSFPAIEDLRPTPDRVRETLFNWLGQDLHGLSCLDLFAGSGALGFEAASRGARRVVMVEQDARVVRALEASRVLLGAPPGDGRIEIVRAEALHFLQGRAQPAGVRHDVVFLDPPFRLDLVPALLPAVAACLAPEGRVYVECAAPAAPLPSGWMMLREARAGGVQYRLIARDAIEAGRAAPTAHGDGNPDTLSDTRSPGATAPNPNDQDRSR